MNTQSLQACQKSKYLEIVKFLWGNGPEEANKKYSQITVKQFIIANKYYDSLRCDGCHCGFCVGLGELASNLITSPTPLQPIANLAITLGQKVFDNE